MSEELRRLIDDLRANPPLLIEFAELVRGAEMFRRPWPHPESEDAGLAASSGTSNNGDILKNLVGEEIAAAFFASEPGRGDLGANLYLVMKSGYAFVLGRQPSYWVKKPEDVQKVIDHRRKEIERNLGDLRQMPGVRLP